MHPTEAAALLLDARRDAQAMCLSPVEALAKDISDRLFAIRDKHERDRELAKVVHMLARTSVTGWCGPLQDMAGDIEHDCKQWLDAKPGAFPRSAW